MLKIFVILIYAQLNTVVSNSINTDLIIGNSIDTLRMYQLALKQIEAKKWNGKSCLSRYNVSEQQLSFETLSWFFKDELKPFIEVKTLDILAVKAVHNENEKLIKLGRKRYSNINVFLTEIRNNLFFVEVIKFEKKSSLYNDRPDFGESCVFMFLIENGDTVKLMHLKKVAYN